eukprot:272622-Chlamydomonas_euryale.AAC.8
MYTPYAPLVCSTFWGWLGGFQLGSIVCRTAMSAFVRPTPSMLALNPTPSSFPPLRTMDPQRSATENGKVPGCTLWNAFSGQCAKADSRVSLPAAGPATA